MKIRTQRKIPAIRYLNNAHQLNKFGMLSCDTEIWNVYKAVSHGDHSACHTSFVCLSVRLHININDTIGILLKEFFIYISKSFGYIYVKSLTSNNYQYPNRTGGIISMHFCGSLCSLCPYLLVSHCYFLSMIKYKVLCASLLNLVDIYSLPWWVDVRGQRAKVKFIGKCWGIWGCYTLRSPVGAWGLGRECVLCIPSVS